MDNEISRATPINCELRFYLKHKSGAEPGFRIKVPINSLAEADKIVQHRQSLNTDLLVYQKFKVYSSANKVVWDYETNSPGISHHKKLPLKRFGGHKPGSL